MVYYLALLICIILFYIVLYKILNTKHRKGIFLIISFLSMSLLSCFRDFSVGADTLQWVEFYTIYGSEGLKAVNFLQKHEPGYVLLNVILSWISPDPRLLIIVSSLFINFSVCYFIGKHSRDPFLSVLFYICTKQFFGSMCMVRQFLAMSIVLLAFNELLSRKYLRFSFAVLVSASFHYFAILNFLLIPIFCIGKLRTSHYILIAVLLAVCFVFMPQIVTFFLTNVSNYSDYLLFLHEQGADPGGFIFPSKLIIFAAYIAPYLFPRYRVYRNGRVEESNLRVNSNEKSYSCITIIYVLIACLLVLSSRFTLLARIYDYFFPFLMLLPNVIDTQNNKDIRVYYTILNLVYILYAVILQRGLYGTENFIFFWS